MKIYDKNGNVIGELYNTPENLDKPTNIFNNISSSFEKISVIFNQASNNDLNEFYDIFSKYARVFNVQNETQENFFLAQIVAETGYGLKGRRENLNYSCSSLKRVFKRYRNNPKWAERDGRCNGHPANQVNIGNVAYANRIGNGDIASGDGYRFRGGGYFQLTGRANYIQISNIINKLTNENVNLDTLAEKITSPKYATLSALSFWYNTNCYKCTDIDCVTEKVNKYTDTYQKRKKIYQWIASI